MTGFFSFIVDFWGVLGQMAPYLLLGFFLAGVLSVCLSPAWVERHLAGHGFWPVFKAALFGVPLPLCSCSVIPVSASIRRSGAARSATTAFLISTPETGVDGVFVTYSLLGPVFAIWRPISAFIMGIIGGTLVAMIDGKEEEKETENAEESTPECCCAAKKTAEEKLPEVESCCSAQSVPQENGVKKQFGTLRHIFQHAFVTLPRDIGPALLIGVTIAAAITALVEPGYLGSWLGSGILGILVLMAFSVPMYVCATASVPIAAGFLHLGASPGAALAFLIAGPATNAVTLSAVWKMLGPRVMFVYLAVIVCAAIGSGLLLNQLEILTQWIPKLDEHVHSEHGISPWSHLWAAMLLAVLAPAIVRKYFFSKA